MKELEKMSEESAVYTPLLASLEKKNFYEVQVGYFDVFSKIMMQKIQESPSVLDTLSKKNAYSVPTDYFEQFSASILENAKRNEVFEETNKVAPLLASLEKKQLYELPASYFSTISHRTPQWMTQPVSSKKVFKQSWLEKWINTLFAPQFNFAFAAACSFVLIFTIVPFSKEKDSSLQLSQINQLSDEEINDYLAYNTDLQDATSFVSEESVIDVEKISASDVEIEQYLHNEADFENIKESNFNL